MPPRKLSLSVAINKIIAKEKPHLALAAVANRISHLFLSYLRLSPTCLTDSISPQGIFSTNALLLSLFYSIHRVSSPSTASSTATAHTPIPSFTYPSCVFGTVNSSPTMTQLGRLGRRYQTTKQQFCKYSVGTAILRLPQSICQTLAYPPESTCNQELRNTSCRGRKCP